MYWKILVIGKFKIAEKAQAQCEHCFESMNGITINQNWK